MLLLELDSQDNHIQELEQEHILDKQLLKDKKQVDKHSLLALGHNLGQEHTLELERIQEREHNQDNHLEQERAQEKALVQE